MLLATGMIMIDFGDDVTGLGYVWLWGQETGPRSPGVDNANMLRIRPAQKLSTLFPPIIWLLVRTPVPYRRQ